MFFSKKNNIAALGCLIIFAYSMALIVPYVEGDQVYYRDFYEVAADASITQVLALSGIYLGAYEPISPIILWVGAALNVNKDIYISFLNTFLAISLIKFLLKHRSNWILIFLIVTNYYVVVLFTGAERLKISYIFIMLYLTYNFKFRSLFLIVAILSHFQSLILIISALAGSMGAKLNQGRLSIKLNLTSIVGAVISIMVFLIVIYLLNEGLVSKFHSYSRDSFYISDFLQVFLLTIVVLPISKNKFRMLCTAIAAIPFLIIFGGSRVNMIFFFLMLYYLVVEGRQNRIPVYGVLAYFSVKSLEFVQNIYTYGGGFEG